MDSDFTTSGNQNTCSPDSGSLVSYSLIHYSPYHAMDGLVSQPTPNQ